ncbi:MULTISPECIES: TauD/TfdA dioxygenase family protein [Rhodococcus]|uniref:TauD/TfdA dioxygenase family protein n=1 Tax=Rhodococcus TaxID=1827 RepID=UPI001E453746|nr:MULTISPECIES: TauD/TfdA family dioxygenase [Rhodococcus]MCD2105548.1 TauD/TfdA family dioxygenase [Rhodococcus qingshengii]MCZ4523847.1 TauD/TfdA family dioxygenase [Rhodococcus erythropolis]MDV8006546.1 TauD/TfdA family dioxygenase [Rhodococcus sp. IEGM 1318]
MATLKSSRTVRIGNHTIEFGPRGMRRNPEGVESNPYERFTLTPVTPFIGAEISDIDLRDPSEDQIEDLRRALLEWKVVFFRDQPISSLNHRDFAAHWGELEIHPLLPQGEVPAVVRFERGEDSPGTENIWHVDVTWTKTPPLGSVLRAIDVPPAGGDTLWADMGNAFDCLPDEIKELIDGKDAIHDFVPSFGRGMSPEKLEQMKEQYPPVLHPMVRKHPETGRKTLFVNSLFTTHIPDMDPAEGNDLLNLLFAQVKVPDFQCRFKWAPNSIAFWDNRATQHYAASDYFPHRRVMERVAILGDVPF